MSTNEILEQVRATKERLWREADGDVRKFSDQLQEFCRKNPRTGPVLRTPEEVRRFIDFGELPTECVREDETKYEPGTP